MKVIVRNTPKLVSHDGDKSWWKWHIQVLLHGGAPMTLRQVTMQLHPTFLPSFELLRLRHQIFKSRVLQGWGTFDVMVELTFYVDAEQYNNHYRASTGLW